MQRSLWLQELADELNPAPALGGHCNVDVAIVGGGFVGLWTALRIRELAPEKTVAILEQDICGAGASGRNGGFVMSWWPKISSLTALCGATEALRLARASAQAIEEIEVFCEKHAIDAHFVRSGWLWTATTEAQRGAWQSVQRTCAKLGEEVFSSLSDAEIARRCGSPMHLEGVFEAGNATVHPARLVRGLRRVALEQGVRIFENSRVRQMERGQPMRLYTDHGQLRAQRVVLATNAWSAELPQLRRSVLPVSSTIIATAPIPERLQAIGWTGGEAITDSQQMVDYYRTTRDGRIIFGKGTGLMSFASRVGTRYDQLPQLHAEVEEDFRRLYPQLADVPIEYHWSGPIDRTYDSLPVFGCLQDAPQIIYGVGWSGNGVGPSRLGGLILASLALDLDNQWSRCGLVNRSLRRFPPEPLRYCGGLLVRNAVKRKERAQALGRAPSWLAHSLSKLAPAGLEDKNL